jgi:hypothetical protein
VTDIFFYFRWPEYTRRSYSLPIKSAIKSTVEKIMGKYVNIRATSGLFEVPNITLQTVVKKVACKANSKTI